ncbi:tomoregulin-1-like [Oscarella lobularis]|uniref:tomoregulin-1-like n=1 Tax=Oscarella lobularis TaxID=121494 RepID=UPI0033138355
MTGLLAILCVAVTTLAVQFPDMNTNHGVEVEMPLTPCQMKRAEDKARCSDMIGCGIVECDPDGSFSASQCHPSTGHCKCVDLDGNEIEQTDRGPSEELGYVDCKAARKAKADLSDALPELRDVVDEENDEVVFNECTQDSNCPFHGVCSKDGTCTCLEAFSFVYWPVCGSNGVTYSNENELKADACKKKMDINVAYYYACEPRESVEMSCDELECMGQGQECVESVDGVGKCACISSCDDYDVEPVCGDDGASYDNGCYLDAAACKKRTSITKAKDGRCEDESDVVE